jgi:hypothetical protein
MGFIPLLFPVIADKRGKGIADQVRNDNTLVGHDTKPTVITGCLTV